MAKGKSSNPMDAYRKAQRAKELKKNKESRTKAREVATLKKDVGPLEAEVRKLTAAEQAKSLDKNGQARLAELRAEVTRIKKAKEEYVAAHPEHRKFVYSHEDAREQARKAAASGSSTGEDGGPAYDKKGRLKDPTRSIYYDPVLNPFGAPPPGMPYMEKPVEGEDSEDDDMSSDDEDSDDDIAMPEGPPPGTTGADEEGGDSDSDDSIVMPEGTPPPEARLYSPATTQTAPPPPVPPFGMQQNPGFPAHVPPPFPMGFQGAYPPPMGFQGAYRPPMQYGQGQFQPHPYASANGFMPPPPRGFFPGNPGNQVRPGPGPRPNFRPPPATANLPPRPGGIVSDPLSDVPHQTFQAHRQAKREEAVREGDNHVVDSAKAALSVPASAEISAAPQLRDLRKEAAIFVPRVAKKKKAPIGTTVITAAPMVAEDKPDKMAAGSSNPAAEGDSNGHVATIQSAPQSGPPSGPTYNPASTGGGLLSKLSGVLGTPAAATRPKEANVDDYKTFLAGLEKLDQ